MKLFSYLILLSLLAVGAITGAIPAQAALIGAFTLSAALAPINRSLTCVCPTPWQSIPVATEHLSADIYRKASWNSVWFNYIKRGVFPKNAGVTMTEFVIGNSEPTSSEEAWVELSLSSNQILAGGARQCAATYVDVDVGYNAKTYVPRKIGLAGPVICREDLYFMHNPLGFMGQYLRELTKRARRTWELEFQNRYIRLADKYVARPGGLTPIGSGTAWSAIQLVPTSQLTQSLVDQVNLTLIENGATDADGDEIELGADGPIFPWVIGIDAIQKLLSNDTNGFALQQLYANMGKGKDSEFLKRIGATRVFKNARIIPTGIPPRYSFTPGVGYSRVATWEMVAGTQGTVAQLTSAYKNALYELAVALHPQVMEAQMIAPESAGLDWNPNNYMGEWVWKTGGDISTTYCFDPKKNYGRHFADFHYAPKSIYPEFGASIMFKRCPGDQFFTGCSS